MYIRIYIHTCIHINISHIPSSMPRRTTSVTPAGKRDHTSILFQSLVYPIHTHTHIRRDSQLSDSGGHHNTHIHTHTHTHTHIPPTVGGPPLSSSSSSASSSSSSSSTSRAPAPCRDGCECWGGQQRQRRP
jgi:hypothetical protein